MATHRSPRLATAHAVLDAYSTLNVDDMLEPLALNFRHVVLPASIGMPTRERDAFAQHAASFTQLFLHFAMVPQTVYEDETENSVVVYAKMIGELKGIGPWENECVLMMRMSEDGTKVVETREFVDSAKAMELRRKLAEKMDQERADKLMQ